MNYSMNKEQIETFEGSKMPMLLSKTAIKDKVVEIETMIEEGFASALDVKVFAKSLEETYKAINDSSIIKEHAISEAEKYGKEAIVVNGATLKVTEVGTTYDFTNSPAWVSIQNDIDLLIEQRKRIEALAKVVRIATDTPDHNGELLQVLPALKKSITSVTVSLKK